MNIMSMLATCVTVFLLLADTSAPVAVEANAATKHNSAFLFAIVFGVCAAGLSIAFGFLMLDEIEKVRQLKKRNADIEERYRQVRTDMLREMDRRHQTEQALRAIAPTLATTATAAEPMSGTYTISSALAPGASPNVFPLGLPTGIGGITLNVTQSVPRSAAMTAPPPDQNHFARIAVPRRFLRLD